MRFGFLLVTTGILGAFCSPARTAEEWRLSGGASALEEKGAVSFALPAQGAALSRENVPFDPGSTYALVFEAVAREGTATIRAGADFSWHEFTVDGIRRPYRVYLSSLKGSPRPAPSLTVSLAGGSPATIWAPAWRSVLRRTAGELDLGLGSAVQGKRYWVNACFAEPEGKTIPDMVAANCSFPGPCASFRLGEAMWLAHGPRAKSLQERGTLLLEIRDLAGGIARTDVSQDGTSWTLVREMTEDGVYLLSIPDVQFPTGVTHVRVGSPRQGGGSFRLARYSFAAEYADFIGSAVGNWYFVEAYEPSNVARFQPETIQVSSLVPGRQGKVSAQVTSAADFRGRLVVEVRQLGTGAPTFLSRSETSFFLRPGEVRQAEGIFSLDGGRHEIAMSLVEGGETRAGALVSFTVPLLHRAAGGSIVGRSQGVTSWTSDLTDMPSRERLPPIGSASSAKPLSFSLAAGDSEAFLFVVAPQRELEGFTFSVPGEGEGVRLDRKPVDHVFVGAPSRSEFACGLWPDPVLPFQPGGYLPGQLNHVFRMRVEIDPGCAAGSRSLVLEARGSGDTVLANLPIKLEIMGFNLASAPQLPILSPVDRAKYASWWTDAEERDRAWEELVRTAAEYGVSPETPFLDPWEQKGSEVALARERFSGDCAVLARHKPAALRLPLTAAMETSLAGTTGEGVPQRASVVAALGDAAAALREAKLLEAAYVALADKASAVEATRAALGAGLRVMLFDLPREDIRDRGVIWCAPLSRIAASRPKVAPGQELWGALDGTALAPFPLIDGPAGPIRGLGAFAWGLGVRGLLVGGLAGWGLPADRGPWNAPMTASPAIPGTAVTYGNGAGFLFWPAGTRLMKLEDRTYAAVGSLRAEILRQAAEDWRRLELLATLLAASKAPAEELKEAQACVNWARGLAAPPSPEETAWGCAAAGKQIERLTRASTGAGK